MARQADPETHPGLLAAWMAPFAGCFTRPTWANLLVLATGALLCPGRRTAASALSSAGLRGAAWFEKCHFQVTPEIGRALMVKGFFVLGVTLI